jgi:hypothetical protein
MRAVNRIVSIALLGALSILISGCGSLNSSSWDPTDIFDFLDTKKRAVGERKPVFPQGVPGVAQGVPPELMKGTPEHAAAMAVADPTLAPPPAETPPAPPPQAAKKRVAATPTRIRVTPNEQQADPNAEQASPDSEEPPPASPPPRKRSARSAPADQQAVPQQSQSTLQNPPLQSGTFQRQ